MSHWNKLQSSVVVKLNILDISFTKNDYFLKNSRYTIFQKNNKKNRIKSLRSIKDAQDLLRIPMEETMILRATIYQEKIAKNTNKFLPKSRKVIIRQLSKLNGDTVYKDIGYLELKLHEVVLSSAPRNYEFVLNDPGKHAQATVRVNIEWEYERNKKGTMSFGLCSGRNSTDIREGSKYGAEFFQNLRSNFTIDDEDLVGIPNNASVYGNLNESYSNLLKPGKHGNRSDSSQKEEETADTVKLVKIENDDDLDASLQEEFQIPVDHRISIVVDHTAENTYRKNYSGNNDAQSRKAPTQTNQSLLVPKDSMTDLEEEVDDEMTRKRKGRLSRHIARKLNSVTIGNQRFSSTMERKHVNILSARLETKILFLGSDDDSDTDQENDDEVNAVGEIIRESELVQREVKKENVAAVSKNRSKDVDMSFGGFAIDKQLRAEITPPVNRAKLGTEDRHDIANEELTVTSDFVPSHPRPDFATGERRSHRISKEIQTRTGAYLKQAHPRYSADMGFPSHIMQQ